jgi:hypothetical protein
MSLVSKFITLFLPALQLAKKEGKTLQAVSSVFFHNILPQNSILMLGFGYVACQTLHLATRSLLPLDGMLVHLRLPPQLFWYPFYTPGLREALLPWMGC